MATIKIITNLPAIIVEVWDGRLQPILKKHCSPLPIVFSSSSKSDETIDVNIDIEKKGLYVMRISLPYFSDGQLFPMAIIMDKYLTIQEDDSVVSFDLLTNFSESKL